MAQMNVSIPDKLKSWAESRVAEGRYSSTSDYVRDLVRRDQEAEERLWNELRGRRLAAAKFVRQYQIGEFIADFACRSLRLAIELDGGQHSENERDAARTRVIEAYGYRVIRFWNNEVLENMDGVLQAISHELELARN
jgi:putative addiction module CopG family antidote